MMSRIMDVLRRILDLRLERGWSEYRLSEESGIAQTTISSWFRKNICPTVPSLEKICQAYSITLSEFFSEEDSNFELTEEQKKLVHLFSNLNKESQNALLDFLSKL